VVRVERWIYGDRQVQVEAQRPGVIAIRTFAYPGWQVWQDNRIMADPDVHPDGRIQLILPPGKTQIRIHYRGTWAERAGLGISGLMASGLIGVIALERIRS